LDFFVVEGPLTRTKLLYFFIIEGLRRGSSLLPHPGSHFHLHAHEARDYQCKTALGRTGDDLFSGHETHGYRDLKKTDLTRLLPRPR
jgi:hypothetical protein